MERKFILKSNYAPSGDQPKAINSLLKGLNENMDAQTLLGVTGSGKTFTVANVIAEFNKPTLVIAHNKTLAAQLYSEFKELFPDNAVEYFISYYDYYQPEAYIPRSDVYIEKSAQINEEIDRLRHSATRSLYSRNDVIVVASVSCIYGLGLPENYFRGAMKIELAQEINRDELLRNLVKIRYERNDVELKPGTFRARGDIVEIMPAYENVITRIYFFGDEIEKILQIDGVTGEVLNFFDETVIFPAVHYLQDEDDTDYVVGEIQKQLKEQVRFFESQNKILEAQRLEQRTMHDIEMIKEMGYCTGIENYSRIIERREPDSAPATLLEYFPKGFLTIIDESHATIPQLKAMFNGDRSRKDTLIEYGFRLPCARDNRPLKIEEFWERVGQKIYISATPGDFEQETSAQIVEQIIRPTGLLDPEVEVRPIKNQVDNLHQEILDRVNRKERVLITTLTKKMAEDLTDYMATLGVRVKYLHSDIASIERVEILRDLRMGEFDVLIGVNLLREGLDLPEVSLVVIMDADKEGFLRSQTSLIQTIGRAARNSCGKVIMYADRITDSMKSAIDETKRRRTMQHEYNVKHSIIPKTIVKDSQSALLSMLSGLKNVEDILAEQMAENHLTKNDLPKLIDKLEKDMNKAARALDFERAAQLRDKLKELRSKLN